MTGIIDIGSNTIRLSVYGGTKRLSNTAVNSEIIADTENGILSENGIEKLCESVRALKEKAGDIPVYVIATYAVRVLENAETVRERIFEKTGLETDILSGEREAEYDFYGLMTSLNPDESGIGVDLGGGSGQIMIFEKGKPQYIKSYPIGSRRIKNKFVKGKFPTGEEKEEIDKYVKSKLKNAEIDGRLYIMGGTAKTAVKLYSYLNGSENKSMIKTDAIEAMEAFVREMPEKQIKKILKNRYDNFAAGLAVMRAVAEHYGKTELYVKQCGVREGYLAEKSGLR